MPYRSCALVVACQLVVDAEFQRRVEARLVVSQQQQAADSRTGPRARAAVEEGEQCDEASGRGVRALAPIEREPVSSLRQARSRGLPVPARQSKRVHARSPTAPARSRPLQSNILPRACPQWRRESSTETVLRMRTRRQVQRGIAPSHSGLGPICLISTRSAARANPRPDYRKYRVRDASRWFEAEQV